MVLRWCCSYFGFGLRYHDAVCKVWSSVSLCRMLAASVGSHCRFSTRSLLLVSLDLSQSLHVNFWDTLVMFAYLVLVSFAAGCRPMLHVLRSAPETDNQ